MLFTIVLLNSTQQSTKYSHTSNVSREIHTRNVVAPSVLF